MIYVQSKYILIGIINTTLNKNMQNINTNIDQQSLNSRKQDLPPQDLTDSMLIKKQTHDIFKAWLKITKKSRNRLMILEEWKTTQQSYLQDLRIIVQKIHNPLKKANIITSDQELTLFPNFQQMISLSSELLKVIKELIDTWHPHKTCLGSRFIFFYKFFIIYREYSNNFYKSLNIIKAISNNALLQMIQATLMPLDIQSYLIKPIQRPPKYLLFLKVYQKQISNDHMDYEALQKAILKAHEVNVDNNQSMEQQMKHDNLIDLEHRYGDIITQNMRFYIGEYDAFCLDIKVKVYLFTDLVLIVKRKFETLEQQWNKGNSTVHKKVPFDASSFVELLQDCKYMNNRLFLCGSKDNVHLSFTTKANRDIFSEAVQKLLTNMKENENQKKNRLIYVQSKAKQIKMSNINVTTTSKVVYQPDWKIIVSGVEKRPLSAFHNETYYILKFQTLLPDKICQYVYIRWSQLLQIDKSLREWKKQLQIPLLDDQPADMSYYDSFEQYTLRGSWNYIFRSDDCQPKTDAIRKKLRINDFIWKFVTSNSDTKNSCECSQCFALAQAKSLKEVYEIAGLSFYNSQQERQNYSKSNRISSNYTQMLNNPCVFAAFKLTHRILQANKQQFRSLEERLLWIDCNCGRINYSLLKLPQITELSKVKVFLLNIMNDKDYVEVSINSETLVYDVLEEIGQTLGIMTMKDFGLFLDYKDTPRLLDLDQNIEKVMNQVNSQIEKVQPQMNNSGLLDTLGQNLSLFTKWSSDILVGKKSRLYIKKYITIEPELEVKACQYNHQRARVLVHEVFYRFNREHLVLTKYDSKQLCGLFYVIHELQELSEVRYQTFKIEILEILLPESKQHWLEESNVFRTQVFNFVHNYQERVNKYVLKTEQLYAKVIKLVANHIGWSSIFFEVVNYTPNSLPGGDQNLLVGVSFKKLVIMRRHQITPLLQIDLDKLDYKITPFSLFICIKEITYRFNGHIMYNLKKIIGTYKNYAAKFQN